MKGNRFQGRSLRRQQGTETVEFAISATLLFLLLFGIIEFSVMLFDKATLTNASREGARTGILFRPGERSLGSSSGGCPEDGAKIITEDDAIRYAACRYAKDYLISLGGLAEMKIHINRYKGDYNLKAYIEPGDEVVVSIEYPYKYLLLPGFLDDIGGFLDISAITNMRAE
ncbi:TadE/TadG family type IV pilus assembly protein [Billgrantia antri]|uniref:TadE/TadG family type IV pilus assembly protein n=1 Tax=Billgrantia antri TaxID=2846777 RepID=UPI003B210B81